MLITPGGGEVGGRAQYIRHERMTPDPLACGELIAVFVCEYGYSYYDPHWVYVPFGLMSLGVMSHAG